MSKESHPLFQQRLANATTRIVKIVFPNTTNHYDTLFGGTALQWMDEVASIASIRFSRQQTVTVSLDRINFTQPIPSGTFVELVAEVAEVGRTSMKIQVDVYLERMDRDGREKAISGLFTFVAINAERKPIPIIWDRPLEDFSSDV
ncbi:MAG: acyl-CoA thioesterase [Candidatus Sericytochromatia bacterium]